jgi:hypothetical protein
VQALDAALAADPADPAALAKALQAADALMAERGLDVALAREYAEALATQDMRLLGPAPRGVAVRLLLRAGDWQAAAAAAGDAPEPGVVTLLAVAGHGTMVATGGDLERAALAGLTLDTPGDEREARLAAMLDEGRQGEAILTALGLLEDGEETDPVSLRAALFTLRRSGKEDAAREIALQTLIRAGR